MSDKLFVQIGDEKVEANREMLDYLEAWQNDVKAHEAEQDAKKAVRTSALAKLAALGLTEEEIAAL